MAVDKAKVEKQAKEILEKFAHALEKVGMASPSKDGGTIIDREEFERVEGKTRKFSDASYKQKFLNNTPNHDDDFVIAEKGSWK